MPRFRTDPRAFLKARFLRFRREILVVACAVRHPGTPWHLRIAGLLLLAYLASPVDLVPLFVPVLGLVDDLLLVPWGLSRVVGALPGEVRAVVEARADRFIARHVRRPLVFLAWLLGGLVLLWVLLLAVFWHFIR
jgi:uncharacterized membrane protein YkvA (DUF1232 family)